MAISQVSAALSVSIRDVSGPSSSSKSPFIFRLPTSNFAQRAASFARGSPLVIQTSSYQTKAKCRARPVLVRCEQSTERKSGFNVWLGRLAMVGFAVAISVEISTGKGLLENFGLTTPLPTVALALTALVGVLAAIFIFQSASDN
ncbi:hypothetical protein Nepgr_019989 [Nepenthes gracilis]|uniref:Stress enhanced protein 1, chloroplastic n=1 Tax=Nepenthes gracilis TaxID=150966 RepID=A0AAD3XUW0_NEPGR|nr:hypothetical protein Nepgr_019989 [Nepenthes gracilis]